jgi:mRNA interferase RelE/StbE
MYRQAVDSAIEALRSTPLKGKPLKGRLGHLRSLRVGVYRIVYRVDARAGTVIIETVRHRSEAYR